MVWHNGVKTGITWPVLVGLVTLATGLGGFSAWAAMAPLEGAIIAQAKVAVLGRNKVVQHLEGGIVKEIFVEDGQRVVAGDALLVLDDTAIRSQHNRLKIQLATLDAIIVRALAERNGSQTLTFPAALAASQESPVATLLKDQQAEFEAGLHQHRAKLAIMQQQIAALEEQISGHAVQKRETRFQIELLAEELQSLEALLAEGLTRKKEVLALKRSEATLKGAEGQLAAAIAQARQSIAEIRERINQTESERVGNASALLSEVRSKRSEIIEQLNSTADVSARVVVRAPVSGNVIGLAKSHPGAVIAPGQEIMTIVPEGTALVVEAQIRPQDIDEVRIGQAAWLTFSAFDPRETPPVSGEVIYVSADRLENQRTGEAYYIARLEVSKDAVPGFDPARLAPGLGAEVFITTGGRTFLNYLTAPLTRVLSRSFRET
ncbi:HlyD family secretion protein [Hoeflea halophila]|uniref:Membrane fusion protein (MFP) family protein n=2 Tax=Hoeflea halophila TaxID=714899 RepID=A0A286IAX5_9HYPH|nr:HlyD family secretion protein [Hoeflea halophila]